MMVTLIHVFVILVGWSSRYTILHVASSGADIDVVDIVPVIDYKFQVFDKLDKDDDIAVFESVTVDRGLRTSAFCNFKPTSDNEGRKAIIPFACTFFSNCKIPLLDNWADRACAEYAEIRGFEGDYVCCPINFLKSFLNYSHLLVTPDAPGHEYYKFNEVPTHFERFDDPYTALTSAVNTRLRNDPEFDAIVKPSYGERLSKELVCGFKTGFRKYGVNPDPIDKFNSQETYYRNPFFCTPHDKCRNDHDYPDRKPEPGWNIFCQNHIKPRPEHKGKTVCCNSLDIVDGFFGFKYIPTPQLPLFLKYSPGLRSAYKCEEYSKYACKDKNSKCITTGKALGPQKGENPHMAVLGFVVPKLMLFHCGGALISVRYVISSASCKKFRGYTTNVVILGEYDISDVHEVIEYEKTYVITEILEYQKSGFKLKKGEDPRIQRNNVVDLALYRTDIDVRLSQTLRPACIFHHVMDWPSNLDFIGFGAPEPELHKRNFLKTLYLPVLERRKCTEHVNFPSVEENPFYGVFGVKNDYMMCYGSHKYPGNAPCQYDVGGPLQINLDFPYCSTQVLGVLSSFRDLPCTSYIPSVFINISHFIEEIEDQVWGDYTFLGLDDKDFEKPSCALSVNLTFFNKCKNGQKCDPLSLTD